MQILAMTKREKFQNLLTRAAKSAQRNAFQKKLPFAISENGEVKLVYPDKKVKVVHRSTRNEKPS